MERHRKKLKRFEIEGQYRYLTCSCYKQLPLLNNDSIKQLLVDQIIRARELHHFHLAAWVIMPEHFHLLLRPVLPESSVPQILNAIKSPLSRRVLSRWRVMDAPILRRMRKYGKERFWQAGGGYDRNIYSYEELWEKLDYIHANSVRRELSDTPTNYKWSSANWYSENILSLIHIDPVECEW